MNHWIVPAVTQIESRSLPRAPNMSREDESLLGTSMRDSVAFSYSYVKRLINLNKEEELKEFLVKTVLRIVFNRLAKLNPKGYFKLSVEERLDLALLKNVIDSNQRTLIHQLIHERGSTNLLHIFIVFLRELQENPLHFEPLVTLCMKDKDIFPDATEFLGINRNCTRTL